MSTTCKLLAGTTCLAMAMSAGAAVPGVAIPAAALPAADLRPEVSRSVDLASWKLDAIPECRALLDDFRDLRGRPLSENLAATGLAASAYLRRLALTNGERHPLCRGAAYAVTVPFGDRVAVCEGGFLSLQRRDISRSANILIHEMLHTLGLGEDGPHPSSQEITARVASRCGG